jgi:hypothetical protein
MPYCVSLVGQPTIEGPFHCQTNTEADTFVKNDAHGTRSTVDGRRELTNVIASRSSQAP